MTTMTCDHCGHEVKADSRVQVTGPDGAEATLCSWECLRDYGAALVVQARQAAETKRHGQG